MDLGFNLAQSNRDLKDPTSRQNFGDTSGLLCKNDPILRHTLYSKRPIFRVQSGKKFHHAEKIYTDTVCGVCDKYEVSVVVFSFPFCPAGWW